MKKERLKVQVMHGTLATAMRVKDDKIASFEDTKIACFEHTALEAIMALWELEKKIEEESRPPSSS